MTIFIPDKEQREDGPFHNDQIISLPRAQGFPGSSAGKESACNAGDSGLISGLGRSPGEWISYTLQYS